MVTWVVLFALCELPKWILGQALPLYDGSFYASGEIFREDFVVEEENKFKETSIFEEIYDAVNRKVALRILKADDTITFFYDINIKKKYVIRSFENVTTCEKPQNEDWDPDKQKNVLSILYGPDERKYSFLRDVLTLRRMASVKTRDVYDVRGMSCRVFGFNFSTFEKPGAPEVFLRPVVIWTLNETHPELTTPGQTTAAPILTSTRFPSDITDLRKAMDTSATQTLAVPWEVHYSFAIGPNKKESMKTRIFNFDFIREVGRHEMLEVPDGLYCAEYYKKNVTKPVVANIKSFRYSARVWNTVTRQHSLIKGQFDVIKKLWRFEYTPWNMNDPKSRKRKDLDPLTIIVDASNNRVFKISKESAVCQIISLGNLPFDLQMIIEPSKIKTMTAYTFFYGTHQSPPLNYVKFTYRGGVPCHLWSMDRLGWPPGFSHIRTRWQWCFVNKDFYDPSYESDFSYPVSLDIYILEALHKWGKIDHRQGHTFSFQFYDVNTALDAFEQTRGFDTSPCFKMNERKTLHLTLASYVPPEITRKPQFLHNFYNAIVIFGGSLKNLYLYVNHFQVHQSDTNQTFLEFTIFGSLGEPRSIFSSLNIPNITSVMDKLAWRARIKELGFTFDKVIYNVSNICYKETLISSLSTPLDS
uniref:Putative secreted protein n=1 Tax=Ixodes ricinus TaxID=34613 RepID=A0A6B0VDU0_IXORI